MGTAPRNIVEDPGFEVEITSGGRAYDRSDRAPRPSATLSPVRIAAKERARRRKLALITAALLFFGAVFTWAWLSNPYSLLPPDVVARVNGEYIYERDIARRLDLTRLFNALADRTGADAQLPSPTSILEQIISDRMQVQDARRAGVTVGPDEVDAELQQVLISTGRTPEQLEDELSRYSLTMDDLRAFTADALLVRKYVQTKVTAGTGTTEERQQRYNEWLTNLSLTSKVDYFKPAGLGQAPRVGSEAPDFALKDLNGREVNLKDLRGRPVMINFWATWCPPCRQEIPVIEEMYRSTRHRADYEILGVATQSDLSTVRAFVGEFNMTFPVLPDVDGRVTSLYHILPIPTTFFIDKDGIIREIRVGPVDRSLMEKWLLDR
jgi:peroxiredoxin